MNWVPWKARARGSCISCGSGATSTPSTPCTGSPLDGSLRTRRPQREGLDSLTDFLRLAGVPIPEIERTWQALAKRRVHSIPRIALTSAQLEALRL